MKALIPIVERLRQEDQEFESGQVYTVRKTGRLNSHPDPQSLKQDYHAHFKKTHKLRM
jgi:hypothetical protein